MEFRYKVSQFYRLTIPAVSISNYFFYRYSILLLFTMNLTLNIRYTIELKLSKYTLTAISQASGIVSKYLLRQEK